MPKRFKEDFETENVTVSILLFSEEQEIARCESEVNLYLRKVDDSFDWEGGIRKDFHWEITDEAETVREILDSAVYNIDTALIRHIMEELVEYIVQEVAEAGELEIISREVDLLDFILKGSTK